MGATGRSWGLRGLRPEASSAGSQLLVLMGVSGFAISQPLLSVLGREPTWFTYRSASPGQIVAFAVVVALAVPAILWCTGLALRRVARPVGATFHLLTIGALAT